MEELNELVESFLELTTEDQKDEIEKEIKAMIIALNGISDDKSFVEIPKVEDYERYGMIYALLHGLEYEINKFVKDKIPEEDVM